MWMWKHMARANINVDASATQMILTGLRRDWGGGPNKKKEEKKRKCQRIQPWGLSCVVVRGLLGESFVAFLLQGLQWASMLLLMTFSQFLMDSLVSNFAHHAHGIRLDQLSVVCIDRLCLQGYSFKPLRGKARSLLEALCSFQKNVF